MKKWIVTIFKLLPSLFKRIDRCDELVEMIAKNPYGKTMDQCQRILEIMDKKSRLINLTVMHDRMREVMDGKHFGLLSSYCMGVPIEEIAQMRGEKSATLYKTLRRAFTNAIRRLADDGYDEKRFVEEYLSIPFIADAYQKVLDRGVRADL